MDAPGLCTRDGGGTSSAMTTPDPLAVLLRDYGWTAVVFWLIYRDVWPFIKERIFPAAMEERKRRLEIQVRLEERQAMAMEAISNAVIEIKLAMVSTNERLLETRMAQIEHHKATTDAITLMRERTRPLPSGAEKSRSRRNP